MTSDFLACKLCSGKASKKYELGDFNIFICNECGFHFIDYLDEINEIDPNVDPHSLTPETENEITHFYHHNLERAKDHADLIFKHLGDRQDLKILDVGCGGGLILHQCRERGAEVFGIEFQDSLVEYCKKIYGLEQIYKIPLEDSFWQENYRGHFDAITFWDVIEHVNSPLDMMRSALNLLKPGGIVLFGTPCRDTFYHRFGALSYALSRGKYPSFLKMMYSNDLYSHKQILSLKDVDYIFSKLNLETLHKKVTHEHVYPIDYYLRRILRSPRLAKFATPLVQSLFVIIPIKNKMIWVGKKR